jgi:carbonic anhydrase
MNGGVYAYRREIGADLACKQASKQRKAKLNKAEHPEAAMITCMITRMSDVKYG